MGAFSAYRWRWLQQFVCTRQARAARSLLAGGESIRRRAAVSGHFYIKQIFLPN